MNPSIVKRCLVGAVLAIAATLPGFQQLHTSVEGLKLIADYEGCRLQPYQCSAGGFAGMYDSGGYIPRGQFGIVGENGPEIVNGPANVTSRRNTAALAAIVAGMMGVAAAPAELPPLHPLALPAKGGEAMMSRAATVPPVQRIEAPTQIIIQTQPGQSAQDIAREVARQLDERERRLKAKARSNYSDQGGYDA